MDKDDAMTMNGEMTTSKPRAGGKQYWRSLDEVIKTPEFGSFVNREFPAYASEWLSGSRRKFLKLMGASFALMGMSGCLRWPVEKYAGYARRPPNRNPGVPVHYATSFDLAGVAQGVVVTSFDGRPIKIEGNPEHPLNAGGTDVYTQASVLNVYDPDRSRGLLSGSNGSLAATSWEAFEGKIGELFSADGSGVYVLSEASSSPTVADMKKRFLAAKPKAVWTEYEPVNSESSRDGTKLAFGTPYCVVSQMDQADVILAIDADIASCSPMQTKLSRDFASGRRLYEASAGERKSLKMNRMYAIESVFTASGASADHRLTAKASEIGGIVAQLAAALGVSGAAGALPSGYAGKFMAALVEDLKGAGGKALVMAGERQPAAVHAAVALINDKLGATGTTVQYYEVADADRPSYGDGLKSLAADLNGGKVNTLLIIGGNPAYDAPADLGFAAAAAKAKNVIHFGGYVDETSKISNWHLTQNHYLESWGDSRAFDGTIGITQPLIEPLFDGKSTPELLAILSGDAVRDPHDLVRRALSDSVTSEFAWKQALYHGVFKDSQSKPAGVKIAGGTDAILSGLAAKSAGDFDVVFYAHPHLFDGRFANNGWLQELPEAMTRLSWDNAALISYGTSKQLNIFSDDVVKIDVNGGSVEIPVFVVPGMADGVVGLALGYGRKSAGNVGNDVGVNVYPIRSSTTMGFASGAKVTPTGGTATLATVQDHHIIDWKNPQGAPGPLKALNPAQRELTRRVEDGIVRAGSLKDYQAGEGEIFGQAKVFSLSLWNEHVFDGRVDGRDPNKPTDARQHKWGMAIDLTTCVGCSACVVACQSENNIPVVGKEQVLHGREMHWIRVDRYWVNPAAEPEAVDAAYAPVVCMHCENAPCEPVCPVAATTHSQEGLNMMTYNRCIGTRYCSNNCPYKVRRFNFFDYSKGNPKTLYTPNMLRESAGELHKMHMNPEVTVRTRGVMEKCTYCIQRIENTRIVAKREGDRVIKDGEVITACAQACPTGAIAFGDLNDTSSKVSKLQALQRSYGMLNEELNTKPRTQYLAKIKNENEALAVHEEKLS